MNTSDSSLIAAATTLNRQTRMLRTAMGPAIARALEDPKVIEVLLNPDGALWVDRLGEGRSPTGSRLSPQDAERIIRLVASYVHVEVNASTPIVSAELPETGERFEGVLPPITRAPAFAIRKRAIKSISLPQYVIDGFMTEAQAFALRQAVRERRNIVIAGGTSTGKTTLANALLREIAECGDRVLLLEDTIELQCPCDDHVALRTCPGVATMRNLVHSTMRFRPDRIVVGEVRGGEALDLLKSWSTGHPGGLATLHASSAYGALTRLEQLVQEAVVTASPALIAEAVDVVAFLSRHGRSNRLSELVCVTGHSANGYHLEPLLPSPNA